ncbi:MAG: alpha/beta hydrolase, partial [Verrucomicrobia bacterium]|nr:alpha/beta hydrolase [Verrucomicrobiota bacterium]
MALGAAPKLPEGVEVSRDLEYAQVKGVGLKLDLYRPTAKPSAPMPLVIWVHGGGWSKGTKAGCPVSWLAAKGYAVASLDFRLLPEHPWPAQIEDPVAALRWLRQESGKYGFDAERSAAIGGSSGG